MTSSPKLTSDGFTESRRIKLENGSKISDCETKVANQAKMPSMTESSSKPQALNPAHISGFGIRERRPPFWMECAIPGPFIMTNNGSIGQEILDGDGNVIIWTTDPMIAQLICRLLTEFDEEVGIPTLI